MFPVSLNGAIISRISEFKHLDHSLVDNLKVIISSGNAGCVDCHSEHTALRTRFIWSAAVKITL